MQKQEKNFFKGHRSTFCIKVSFGIGHPPLTHHMQSTCVWEGSRVPNLQTEFNYLDSFKSYGIFSDFVVPTWSPSSPHHPRCPDIIPVVPTSSLDCPHSPQKVPMWSPWLWSPWSPPHVVPIVPVVPSSLSSAHHLEGPHIIPNPPDTHSTHPHPLGGWGDPESVKMQ